MKKILIIEDDRIMRENISELLDLVGYKVETASNGKEGVKKAQISTPDLIICDIKMPVLDGYGVLLILQKDPETATIPFIFLTAKTERNDMRKGMEMGADDYLAKPFEDTELLKAVEVRLKKSKIISKENLNKSEESDKFINEANIISSLKDSMSESELYHYKAKEIIFKTGDFPHYVFYVKEGQVKSFRMNTDGKEFISNIYENGDFFGYQPVFEEREYNETAIALNSTQLYKIAKREFLTLVYKNSGVAGNLIKMISKNLTEKEEELVRIAYDSVRKRVAIKLLELIPAEGDEDVSISRTDLAAMVGTTPETLVRTLTELKELNIINSDTHRIILLDRKKLKEFSKTW